MTTRRLDWGLNAHPEDSPGCWGARAILQSGSNPIDIVGNRQDADGPLFGVLASLLNDAGGLKVAQARVRELQNTWQMSSSESKLFTLVDNDMMTMVANTNGSHGYLYISAWLKAETFNLEGAEWSGSDEPPEAGATVETSVWKRPVKVLTSINLHGHRFLTFLTGRPVDVSKATSIDPRVPKLAVGLTVGNELR
jgi:hypothetical protein